MWKLNGLFKMIKAMFSDHLFLSEPLNSRNSYFMIGFQRGKRRNEFEKWTKSLKKLK